MSDTRLNDSIVSFFVYRLKSRNLIPDRAKFDFHSFLCSCRSIDECIDPSLAPFASGLINSDYVEAFDLCLDLIELADPVIGNLGAIYNLSCWINHGASIARVRSETHTLRVQAIELASRLSGSPAIDSDLNRELDRTYGLIYLSALGLDGLTDPSLALQIQSRLNLDKDDRLWAILSRTYDQICLDIPCYWANTSHTPLDLATYEMWEYLPQIDRYLAEKAEAAARSRADRIARGLATRAVTLARKKAEKAVAFNA